MSQVYMSLFHHPKGLKVVPIEDSLLLTSSKIYDVIQVEVMEVMEVMEATNGEGQITYITTLILYRGL